MQFLDISEASLRKARRLIRAEGLAQRAVFGVGDGAAALREPAQAVIIAGMGANTIEGILSRGREAFSDATLILQPNVGVERLRAALARLGYAVLDEALARAGGRWYVGLSARRGAASYDERELLAGPVLLARRDPMLAGYVQFRLRVQRRAHQGASRSDQARARALAREISLWEEIEAWLSASDKSSKS